MQRICNTLFSEAELEGKAVQPLTRDMNTVSGPLYALVTTKYFSTGPSSEIKHVKQIVVLLDWDLAISVCVAIWFCSLKIPLESIPL